MIFSLWKPVIYVLIDIFSYTNSRIVKWKEDTVKLFYITSFIMQTTIAPAVNKKSLVLLESI